MGQAFYEFSDCGIIKHCVIIKEKYGIGLTDKVYYQQPGTASLSSLCPFISSIATSECFI